MTKDPNKKKANPWQSLAAPAADGGSGAYTAQGRPLSPYEETSMGAPIGTR